MNIPQAGRPQGHLANERQPTSKAQLWPVLAVAGADWRAGPLSGERRLRAATNDEVFDMPAFDPKLPSP
jgi:hypothetical protein